ncbi:unnamed protein product [Lupinus luteus]|uniref:glucan endo-1,3-beta-D-glucosidase n=1 Tax=Lupinus luteus TaxID=3873 RepID=A0AAV1W7A6_LUPLU
MLMVLNVHGFEGIASNQNPIGICNGRVADNLPSAEAVINLYKANGIMRMRIYNPDPETLKALRGSNIELVVGLPNELIQSIATNAAEASQWVQNNIQTYAQDVKFRYIVVGNEIMPNDAAAEFVAPAMQNIYAALANFKLQSQIKVSTAIQLGLLGSSYPPSEGAFSPAASSYLNPILSFLVTNEAPLLANLYTYFSYIGNPNDISLDYALFTSPNVVVQDGKYEYQNLFDASLDALYAALEKSGAANLEVVISESGWPSYGANAATVENANIYYGNLVKHVQFGSPKRPNQPLETYLFALFDENKKEFAETERHFGLFHPNMEPKYQVGLVRIPNADNATSTNAYNATSPNAYDATSTNAHNATSPSAYDATSPSAYDATSSIVYFTDLDGFNKGIRNVPFFFYFLSLLSFYLFL